MLCCCRCYCRYLCGSVLTYVDIRLFMTLIRFDEVYVVYFKVSFRVFIVCILLFFSSLMLTVHFSIWQCNIRELSTYPNITNYMRELYQNETIQSVINMQHIKGHYFTSHVTLNTHGYDTPVYVIEHLLLIRIAEWQCGDHMFVLLILMYCMLWLFLESFRKVPMWWATCFSLTTEGSCFHCRQLKSWNWTQEMTTPCLLPPGAYCHGACLLLCISTTTKHHHHHYASFLRCA